MEQRHPLPPFTMETALQKVQMAEDAWNSKDPERVSLAYSVDTEWRNRTDFINGREAVKEANGSVPMAMRTGNLTKMD